MKAHMRGLLAQIPLPGNKKAARGRPSELAFLIL